MIADQSTAGEPSDSSGFTIEELAVRIDQAPWMVARSVAKLIARGLIGVDGVAPDEAIAELRRKYGEAVNGH